MRNIHTMLCAGLLVLAGCSSEKPEPKKEPVAAEVKETPKAAQKVPDAFQVKFETAKGDFVVEVTKDWAPIGAERFYDLVQDKFFDGAGFFRVVPNFVIQFGLAADPRMTAKWDHPIKDDPVIRTNRRGTLVFATAGPNTRTTQLFVNLKSNQILDDQGFAPFGQVMGSGMDVVDKLYAAYGEQPDQGAITSQGNGYLKQAFPNLDFIHKATVQ
jgi:peptidyl-prolyl cis-trans isomerase A (cyclophilin A)